MWNFLLGKGALSIFFVVNYLKNLGSKLADPTTGQNSYWKILNKFLNKCKIPRIPPILVDDKYITNCKEKASIFNDFFLITMYAYYKQ